MRLSKSLALSILFVCVILVGCAAPAAPQPAPQPAQAKQEVQPTAAPTTAPAPKNLKIGYSQFWGTNPFLITMTNGANKAVKEWAAKGVNIDLMVTNGGDTDTSKQVADVEDLYAQGVQGLLIFPGDSIVLSEPIKNIYNKNKIPVVVTDIGLNSGDYNSFLITDNYLGGQMAAELMAKNLSQGAKVVTFDNGPGNANGQERQKGFEEKAKELGLTVLPEIVVNLSLEDGRKALEDAMVANPDLGGAFCLTQVVCQGAVAALDAAKKPGAVKIETFDVDATSYQLLKDGKILGIVMQDPYRMGYDGLNYMVNILTGGPTPPKRVPVPANLMTKDNAADFANDPQITGK